VSAKTYTADAALPCLLPTAFGVLSINATTDRKITRNHPYESGLAELSTRHFRDSLAWAMRERMIAPAMAISRLTLSRPTSRPAQRAACHTLTTPKTPSGVNAGHQRDDQVGLRQLR
jgi:hypothetical protein